MTAEEIAHKIFYMPATNGKAGISLKEGTEMIEGYAREAIKADRERVVENAKATISTVPGWDQKIKAHNIPQETLISRFCVDPASILNLPIELPKTK